MKTLAIIVLLVTAALPGCQKDTDPPSTKPDCQPGVVTSDCPAP